MGGAVDLRKTLADPAVVLALAEVVSPSLNGASSYRLAEFLETVDAGIDVEGHPSLTDLLETAGHLSEDRVLHWRSTLAAFDGEMVSVLDDSYPVNLRMVQDHPPFLFVRGSLDDGDERAVAVVGTRQPSEEGRRAAERLAGELARRSITVVSGFASGIDSAAHLGALSSGGRTIAVFGTGLDRVYPAANRSLASRITHQGAVVSQFWPDTSPARWTFPVRNIVTSGLALGTVVVEAGPTSGARQQAEHALRHGKRLYLLRHLVEHQVWAQEMIGTAGVSAVDDVDEIATAIDRELNLPADVLV